MAGPEVAVQCHRVLRGGSWNNGNSINLLSSNRNNNAPDNRNDNNGFRLVLVGSGGARKVPKQRRDAGWLLAARPVPRGHLTCTPTPRHGGGKPVVQRLAHGWNVSMMPGKIRGGGPWPVTAVIPTASAKVTARHACGIGTRRLRRFTVRTPHRILTRAATPR